MKPDKLNTINVFYVIMSSSQSNNRINKIKRICVIWLKLAWVVILINGLGCTKNSIE